MWEKIKKAANILWTVGERLRVVYSTAENAEMQRRDRRRTAVCLGAFFVACVALAIADAYGDAFIAARSVTEKVLGLGGGRRGAAGPSASSAANAGASAAAAAVVVSGGGGGAASAPSPAVAAAAPAAPPVAATS